MSSLGNKQVFSKNLKYYIDRSGKDRKELAEIWGFPYSTVTEWINGRKYPRIDRIEIMADYFGILKSDLIEERNESRASNDILADLTIRIKRDSTFASIVEGLGKLDEVQLASIKQIVDTFLISSK